MKVGTVKISELDGNNLSPEHYLDECVHCQGQQNDPRHHDADGNCHRRRYVYVKSGTRYRHRGRNVDDTR